MKQAKDAQRMKWAKEAQSMKWIGPAGMLGGKDRKKK